ncbi:MAG: peptidylprolyl isomerase [Synechococcales cyanobacterium CRU_2_2]|nr:peptidylprolyl isomerase [Synechococcales cyanobacterium CRU_2_2]
MANLPPGNAITDGRALLRYSLPLDVPEIRKVQKEVEAISDNLRAKRWGAMAKQAKKAAKQLSLQSPSILAATPPDQVAIAEPLIRRIQTELEQLATAIENKDKEQTWNERRASLNLIGELEEVMVGDVPFEIPAEYSDLPQLRGRATIELTTTQGPMTVVVDGYNAPLTAGNFVDLVQRGFYDGLPFTRADESFVLQAGDPPGPADGFIDPKTKTARVIPLEIRVDGDDAPLYGELLENLGLFNALPALPFSAYGTLGMARPDNDVNRGSSQFFWFLFEPEMTPAGLNLIDGRYAAFGYTIAGQEILKDLTQADKIISARVVAGAENLVQPSR